MSSHLAAGLDAGRVTGQRAYDESKTAVLAGAAAGAGILLSQGTAVFALASTWIWGIALPMTVAGVATHYLAHLRASWTQFWQQKEKERLTSIFLLQDMSEVGASVVRLTAQAGICASCNGMYQETGASSSP